MGFMPFAPYALAQSPLESTSGFLVQSVRVEGLQRIPVATVYRLLPFEEGQILQADDVARATHDLYNTGNFQDVGIFRQGNPRFYLCLHLPTVIRV